MKRSILVAAMTLIAAMKGTSLNAGCTAPTGYTKAWNGTTSAWSTASNWTPSAVPASTDSVYICSAAAAQPALSANATVANLFIDSGASLDIATFTLTANGNVDAASMTGAGTLSLPGASKTLRGSVPKLIIPNSGVILLNGPTTVNGDATINNGDLNLSGQTMMVTGSFTTSGLGDRVRMNNAADRLVVQGNVSFLGGGASGLLTAGELHVGGNFTENNACCTGTAFIPSGTHTTVFDGGTTQTVTFNTGGNNGFNHVAIGGSGTVVVTAAAKPTAIIKANLIDSIGNRWQATNTTFRSATPTLASRLKTNATFPNASALQSGFTIDGSVNVTDALAINGQTVVINGTLTTSSLGGTLAMTNPTDLIIVNGDVNMNGSGSNGKLTMGEIRVSANFVENGACCVGDAFTASGTHKVTFTGIGAQNVSFAQGGSRFQAMQITSASTLALGTAIDAAGPLIATGGTIAGSGRALTVAGLEVTGTTFDNVALTSGGGNLTAIDGATFQNYAQAATPLTIKHPGAAVPFSFRENRFLVTPTTGKYISATDTATADGAQLHIRMINSTPADGSALTAQSGAIVEWLTILPNRLPDAVADRYETDEDRSLVVNAATGVLSNDTDPDGNSLTATLVTAPARGTLDLRSDGSFTYSPPPDFSGAAGFGYRVDDGNGGSDTAAVVITVNPVNDAPVALPNEYRIASESRLLVPAPGVLSNDSDPDGERLTATLNTLPHNGTVILAPEGGFAYTPNAGFTGIDTFAYDASDGVARSTALVTIVVSVKIPEIAFRASHATIGAGQTATLFWLVSGASSVTIDQGIGAVDRAGHRDVSPATTTTWTLTATSPAGTTTKRVTIEVIGAPEIALISPPRGMIDFPGGRTATDRYTLANLGGAPSNIQITPLGDFFTQSPTSFRLMPGATQTVFVTALPTAIGIHRGESIITGDGIPSERRLLIRLLSIPIPTGLSESAASSYRVDHSDGSTPSVTFTNKGNAPLEGIVVTDTPWLNTSVDRISIPPGESVTTAVQIDRSKRPDRNNVNGSQTASVSLLHFKGGATGKSVLSLPFDTTPPSIGSSTVVVKDMAKPVVTSAGIPPLAAGEIAYYIPGLAHRGTIVGDLSLFSTQPTTTLGDLKMFALLSGASSSSAQVTSLSFPSANTPLALPDLLHGVYGQQSASGSITLRGSALNSVSIGASTVSVGSGFFGGVLSTFRSDRSAAQGATIHLTGVRKDTTAHTDLHLQEVIGGAANAVIDFLDDRGTVIGSRSESLGAFQYIERLDVVPSGTATVRVTNSAASAGSIVARAIIVDETTGDLTDIVDWRHTAATSVGEAQIIPYVARGVAGTTDVTITNSGSAAATVTLDYTSSAPNRRRPARPVTSSGVQTLASEPLSLEPGATTILRDVVQSQFGKSGDSSGFVTISTASGDVKITSVLLSGGSTTTLPVLPLSVALESGEGRQFIDLEDASPSSVSDRSPGTFRTSFGFVETSGSSATVRATLHYAYTATLSTVTLRGVVSKEIAVGANQSLTIPDMARAILGAARDDLGDLHDLQLDLDVIGGAGSVIPYVISTDNGTGDSLFRWE